jgi:hypothetical protein
MGARVERGEDQEEGRGGLKQLQHLFQHGRQETLHAIPTFDESGRMKITDDPFLVPASSLGLPFDIAVSGGGTSLRLVDVEANQTSLREKFDAGLRLFIVSEEQNIHINMLPESERYQALKELSGSSWEHLVESLDGHKPPPGKPYWFIAMARSSDDTKNTLPPDIARFRIDPEHHEIRQYIQNQRLTLQHGDTVNWKLLTRDAPLIIMDMDRPELYIRGCNVIVLPELHDTHLSTFDERETHQQIPLSLLFDPHSSGVLTLRRPMWPAEQFHPGTEKHWTNWNEITEFDREWIFRGVDGVYVIQNGQAVNISAVPHNAAVATATIGSDVQTMILTARTGSDVERRIATFSFVSGWMTFTDGPDQGTKTPQGTIIYQRVGPETTKGPPVIVHTALTRQTAYAILRTPVPPEATGDDLRRYGQRQKEALEFLFPGSQTINASVHTLPEKRARVGNDNTLLVRHG